MQGPLLCGLICLQKAHSRLGALCTDVKLLKSRYCANLQPSVVRAKLLGCTLRTQQPCSDSGRFLFAMEAPGFIVCSDI